MTEMVPFFQKKGKNKKGGKEKKKKEAKEMKLSSGSDPSPAWVQV